MSDDTVVFDGFVEEDFEGRRVWRGGTGPAVIVIHELPGLHPGVVDFARRVVAAGFTAYLPSLFGAPGRPFGRGMLGEVARGCVSREFSTFALGRTSPATGYLRRLAAYAHERCGGPGVGAVGMCFTGGFALAMAVDDRMVAPVLSQPGLPFPISPRHRADVGLSAEDLGIVKRRAAQDGLCVLGLRFTNDRGSPGERFDTLRRELGDRFLAVEIDSSPGNPDGIPTRAHSVLTGDLVDEPGHPTRARWTGCSRSSGSGCPHPRCDRSHRRERDPRRPVAHVSTRSVRVLVCHPVLTSSYRPRPGANASSSDSSSSSSSSSSSESSSRSSP
jgi:dienelactone hydrolase